MGDSLRDRCIDLGADEITLRVSRWGDGDKAECWQCIIKHRDRQRPWGVGVLKAPDSAIRRAEQEFIRIQERYAPGAESTPREPQKARRRARPEEPPQAPRKRVRKRPE